MIIFTHFSKFWNSYNCPEVVAVTKWKKNWCMWAPIGNFICEVVGEKLRKWERLGSSESVGMLWSLVVLCTLVVWWRLRGKLGRSREGSGLLSHGPAGELGDWDAGGSEMLWVGRCGGFDALRCIQMDWDGLRCFEMDWDNGRGCSEASSSQLIRSFPHQGHQPR